MNLFQFVIVEYMVLRPRGFIFKLVVKGGWDWPTINILKVLLDG
jgi:hypothetical protein